MNQVMNVPIKVFLKLSGECKIVEEKLKQLKEDVCKCFNLEQDVCDCTKEGHNTTKRTLNLIKFADAINKYNEEVVIKPKFNSGVDQYLNYQLNIDIKVYMNMVETVNKHIERKVYHDHMVAVEDKERYANAIIYGETKKKN